MRPPLDPDDDALGAFRSVLAALAAAMADHLDGAVAGDDPERLHRLRVGVRRTRCVLANGRGVLPADVRRRFRDSFGRLGEITTPVRDLDVLLLRWDDEVAALPAGDADLLEPVRLELASRRDAAQRAMAAELRGEWTTVELDAWFRWLADPSVAAERPRPVGPLVARRWRQLQRALVRSGRAIDDASPATALHDLRKDAKRLRYMVESFGSLVEKPPRKAFVRRLQRLQDNLGAHQDAEVHLGELRRLATELDQRGVRHPEATAATDRLLGQLDRRRLEERSHFADTFADYDSAATRADLRALRRSAAAG